MAEEQKRSKVELIKEESNYLAGDIAKDLANENPFVSNESYELLKHHGSYQQYDRDTATERKKAGLEKEWQFMLRMKAPGGRLTAEQYLALNTIAADYANGDLRITTRQTFQFHCIIKNNLKKHIAAINTLMLTTLGGCGDVVRNVLCTPAPIKDAVHQRIVEDTMLISDHTLPKTPSYEQLWLDKELDQVVQGKNPEEVEPLYGKHYLTRKFKICVAVPEDNAVDALSHDLALIQIYENGKLQGYNLCIGGGHGMTHNKPHTYPRVATPIAFIGEDELIAGVEAVIKLSRDHADRADRKHARLKYVVEEKGIEWSKKTLDGYMGRTLEAPRPMGEFKVPEHMGYHEQKDGKWYLGVPVPSGRITDRGEQKIRTGLHQVIKKYRMGVVLTPDQNIILTDIEAQDKEAITTTLKAHGIALFEDITTVNRYVLACVALPTCGKALAEAERVQIPFIADIEKVMEKHGILDERLSIRIAGCPNGCSRPYNGDIGIVGRTPDHYAIFVGGDFEGTRLNSKILDKVPYQHLPELFDHLFGQYVLERKEKESYGNFVHRIGADQVAAMVDEKLAGNYPWAKLA